MSDSSAINETFRIERTYSAPPAAVFAAFSSAEAKSVWGDTGELEPVEGEVSVFDFRPGGHERFAVKIDGIPFVYDATYYDIVPDRRIVYAYEMYTGGRRISVTVTTIEFLERDGSTLLTFTEQGAYLDGIDGAEAPELRRGGTAEMLDGLGTYLAAR